MFLIDRRYFRYFDWLSFGIIVAISIIGIFFVFSATYKTTAPFSLFFKKQIFGLITGIIIYLICSISDYRMLTRWGYFLYFAILFLLICTIIKGSIGMGAQRWLDIGIIKFQPSELTKLFLPSFISYYFLTQNEVPHYTFKDFIQPLLILFFTFILVRKQPDLGTALIILFCGLLLLWFAGLKKRFFLISFSIIVISAPLLFHFLRPYQKQRISVFLGSGNKHKEGYQIEQSKIAIGSGGLTGKGFLLGTQNKFMFLPEGRTDFIFSVLCEEWGFSGALLLLLLFVVLFSRFCLIIMSIDNFSTQLLAIGLISHIIISTIINIGMVLELLPTVGIPLPLVSYGISHLWITFASLGLFNSIAIRRYYIGD